MHHISTSASFPLIYFRYRSKAAALCAWLLVLLCACGPLQAQTTLSTTTAFSNNNGSGTVTFNLQNTNTSGILITDIAGVTGTSGTQNVEFWYKTTPVSGAPGAISTANGWILISSGTITGIANTSSTTTQPFFSGLSFLLPANTTYGFAVFATGQRYYTMSAAATIPAGGVNFLSGPNIGYGGGTPPAAPTNSPRGWIGTITFMPALPCTAPPTPGIATTSATNVCTGGSFMLSLTGNSMGTGQTYQWQSSTSATGPAWTNVSAVQNTPNYTATANATLYYRAAVTCGTSTTYATPVQVTVPALFPGGTYTINSAAPTGGTNFQTFGAAVSAISCGIAGPVVFNVAPGSGPYNEQVVIPAINTTAVNTVTFNGNNRTLAFNNTSNSANYAVLQLDGADYFRIRKLTVAPSGTYGYGIVLTSSADHNIIDSCTVNNGISGTSSLFAGIVVGGSATSATGGTSPCDSNIISHNEVIGGYYCVTSVGTSGGLNQGNQIVNNIIRDFYTYGTYNLYNNNLLLEGNELHRLNRTNPSTFYGLYLSTGNLKSRISMNRVHDPFGGAPTNTGTGYFIYHSASATAGNENVFSNNAIYNMNGNGTHYCIYSLGNYGRFYFNTVSADYAGSTSGATYGYYQSSSYTGIEFRNNIISIARGGSGVKYCAYHSSSGYSTVMNHNDYYSTAANKFYRAGALATLASWQTATSQDAASLSVNPNFTAPASGDLSPANLSMDNIGTPVAGITTDITGYLRSATTPDAGAFEFNNPCAPPTGLAASAITVSTATLSWNTIAGPGYEYVVNQGAGNPSGSGTLTTATTYNAAGLTGGTTYYLHLRNKCGATNFSPWVTISFTTCPQAIITPQSYPTFCAGGSVVLVANAGTSYQWQLNGTGIAGATSASYTASGAGSYTVTVTSANGCVSTSLPVAVQAGLPPANITPAGAATICANNPLVMAAPSGPGLTYQWLLNGTPINGATGATYSTASAGSYTVMVSSGAGCTATSGTPTVVSVVPPPQAVITPAAGAAICPGSTLTLNANAGTGLTYQWALNGTNITGATAAAYTGSGLGSYTVKVTATATGCSTTSAPLAVTAAPVPAAVISSPAQLTACDTAMLTANAGAGLTYQWHHNGVAVPGGTAATFAAGISGNYAVKVINGSGCSMMSSSVAVTVHPSPSAVITYTSPLLFCEGSGVVLNVQSAPGLVYQWLLDGNPIPGASSGFWTATGPGSYSVHVTNAQGCARVSAPVPVTVHPAPAPLVSRNDAILSTGSYATYQWLLDTEPLPGANYQTYSATENGAYTVSVTDSNGCTGMSQVLFVNSLGVSGATYAPEVKVYPNPASDIVYVLAPVRVALTLRDITGRVVLRQEGATSMDLRALSDGVYFLFVADGQGRVIRAEKLVKRG